MSFYSSKILVTTWKFSKFTKTCWDSSPCPAFTLLPANCWTGISEVSALSLTSVLLTASSLPDLSLLFPVSLLFPAWRKVSVLWSRPCLCYLSVQFPALNLEWGLFNITTQAVAVVRMYCLGFFVSRMLRGMASVSQWLWINMEPGVLRKFAFVCDKLSLVLNKKCRALVCWADRPWRSWTSHHSLDPGIQWWHKMWGFKILSLPKLPTL